MYVDFRSEMLCVRAVTSSLVKRKTVMLRFEMVNYNKYFHFFSFSFFKNIFLITVLMRHIIIL